MTAIRPASTNSTALVRFFVAQWMLGIALGAACAALLLWLDVAGLRSLAVRSDHMIWEAIVLLFAGFGFFFGGVVCSGAIMSLAKEEDEMIGRMRAERYDDQPKDGRHR